MQLEVDLYLKDRIRFSFALKLKSALLIFLYFSSKLMWRLVFDRFFKIEYQEQHVTFVQLSEANIQFFFATKFIKN